jgi:uncharacterized phage protein (TIGR01671 family)
MREIKFRAWDERQKLMHYDFEFIRSGTSENGSDWIVFKSDKNKLSDEPHPFNNPFFEQQLNIMQFTGLKDEEGVEIFEGDIIETIEQTMSQGDVLVKGHVIFDQDGCWSLDFPDYGTTTGIGVFIDMGMKVIGNIYETPQLLAPAKNPESTSR